jgi:predicted Zn-dependent protease
MFRLIRWLLVAVLGIGVPVFVYLAFIADEPLLDAENDVDLGRKTVESIAADPEEYPLLAEDDYPEAYAYLRGMIREIVQSEAIEYADLFAYDSVRIIDDDNTLNAFCVPGGFIYVYTGLIKYLDAEDHLAGVLGHEIAHAERRHSAAQMQKEFGKQHLLEFVVLSLPMTLGNVAFAAMLNELTNLSYSREHEAESDDYSVQYLADTDYACDGAAGFFDKITRAGDAAPIPEFLSDHPDPTARVRDVREAASQAGCNVEVGDQAPWREFQTYFGTP